ncbi:MAG: ABC transporter permease [Treponema sp.]|jgi:simple sugar transport system permease protein|nr:ABC transporter permease [Treponema sp.]
MLDSALSLLFASLGALWTELAGSLGIFIEGFMSLGSFFTYCLMVKTDSIFVSCLLSALVCAALGFLSAVFVRASKVNPFIAGLALNLAAGGLTNTLSQIWFGTKGVLRNEVFFEIPARAGSLQTSFAAAAALCFVLSAFLVYGTRFGLRLRASGFSAAAAEERGVDSARYQIAAWAIAAMLASIGGSYLMLRVGAYTPGGVSGRGWIALAAVYLGFRNVWGVGAAAFVFALVERAGIMAQSASGLPPTALLGVPSALALVFYAASCAAREKKRRRRGNTP